MARVLTCCIMFFAACLPALAQGDVAANTQLPNSNVVHWIITLGGDSLGSPIGFAGLQ